MAETAPSAASPAGEPARPAAVPPPRLVAVIDIGATAIRMDIAEVREHAAVRLLEPLQQPVRLGKDTFSRGRIEQDTIRECIEILRHYRRLLEEYGVTQPGQIRAVATSSVREAANRDVFLDRIYNATQLNVQAIDEIEESRLTFLAAQDVLAGLPALAQANTIVLDVGGGSTELLLIQKGQLTSAASYRLGSLRMRETLETHHVDNRRLRAVLGQQLAHLVDEIRRNLPAPRIRYLVAMGADAQFAAAQLDPRWPRRRLARLNLERFAELAEKLIPLPVEKLVARHSLPPLQAETIGPALLIYASLARALRIPQVIVPQVSLRDGLFHDLLTRGPWTEAFTEQVVHSAIGLGHKYRFDEAHARHVADLAVRLFQELQPEHHLDAHYGFLLRVAAILHDIGMFVSNRSHHKHSMYLIMNSEVFGLSRSDLQLVALIARYHRRALPGPAHVEFNFLGREDRIAVAKLAALLRVADALDRNHTQQVREPAFLRQGQQLVIVVRNMEDLTLERMALQEKGNMFEEYYGLTVALREHRAEIHAEAHDG